MEIKSRRQIKQNAFWYFVFLIALTYLVMRGSFRGIQSSWDFLHIFDALRCWTLGLNPYLPTDLAVCSVDHASVSSFVANPELYPPPAYFLLLPLARLPVHVAVIIWQLLLLTLLFTAGMRLVHSTPQWDLRVSCFVLAFAPLHTALSLGQPSMLTYVFIALSLTIEQPWLAGVLLGFALCYKWTLALWFLPLAVWSDRRKFVSAIVTLGTVTLGAIVCLKSGSLAAWFAGMLSVSKGSNLDSGSSANPLSYQLLNIDTLLPQGWQTTGYVLSLYLVVLVITAIALTRTDDRWTGIAMVAAMSTFVGYHRFYDASMLCLAIPGLLALPMAFRWLWSCFAVFLLPFQSMAAVWWGSHVSGFWSFILLRHEAIACLLIWATFAIYAVRQRTMHSELGHV